MPWVRTGVNRLVPRVTWQPHPEVPRTLELIPPEGVIVDVGAGGRRITPQVVAVDFIPFAGTDVIADVHQLPFRDGSVHAVVCTGTLEHVEDPARVVAGMRRILREGGIIHLEVPFLQPFHADPEDYWRWTLDGLRLFATRLGFEEIRSGAHLGRQSAINELVIGYFQSWFRNRYFRKGVDIVLSFLFFPLRYLDILGAREFASAVFFVGRRRVGGDSRPAQDSTARSGPEEMPQSEQGECVDREGGRPR